MGLLGTFFLMVLPCTGIEPDKVEGIVYRLQPYTGTEHNTVYSPPQVEKIYLLASSDNTFDPRYTLVYYWPLTQEYFASWERLDIPVEGKLEILKDGEMIQTLLREDVVLSYPEGANGGRSILLKGEKAGMIASNVAIVFLATIPMISYSVMIGCIAPNFKSFKTRQRLSPWVLILNMVFSIVLIIIILLPLGIVRYSEFGPLPLWAKALFIMFLIGVGVGTFALSFTIGSARLRKLLRDVPETTA